MQLLPAGRAFQQQQAHWFKLLDGKVIAHEAIRDDLSTLIQLLGVESLTDILKGDFTSEYGRTAPLGDLRTSNEILVSRLYQSAAAEPVDGGEGFVVGEVHSMSCSRRRQVVDRKHPICGAAVLLSR